MDLKVSDEEIKEMYKRNRDILPKETLTMSDISRARYLEAILMLEYLFGESLNSC